MQFNVHAILKFPPDEGSEYCSENWLDFLFLFPFFSCSIYISGRIWIAFHDRVYFALKLDPRFELGTSWVHNNTLNWLNAPCFSARRWRRRVARRTVSNRVRAFMVESVCTYLLDDVSTIWHIMIHRSYQLGHRTWPWHAKRPSRWKSGAV